MAPAHRVLLAATLTTLSLAAPGTAAPQRSLTFLSPVYEVEGVMRSMTGPQSTRELRLLDGQPPALLWITGYRAEMVAADGETPLPQGFMCHSNLDIDMAAHRDRVGWLKNPSQRLFTLSQGQQEIRFPDGFGIPLWSDELLWLTTQVLNLDPNTPPTRVRHKVTVEFLFDRDLAEPLRPLSMVGATGLVLLEGEAPHSAAPFFGVEQPRPEAHGSGCMVGANAGEHVYEDPQGRRFSGHWVVPPGRQVNRTLVTELMDLPYDTTVHYAAVHLHPFAESLELRDLTTGEVVFTARAENAVGRIGLTRVEHLSSADGVELHRGHQYELTSVYDNPTGEAQDSMAVMFLYVLDREFVPPRPAASG